MGMLGTQGRIGAWTIGAMLLTAGLTRADEDTYRLGGRVDDTPTLRLDQRADDEEAETTLTARYGGGARGGGGRVAAGGFYRGGGGRTFAGGFVRGGGRGFVGGVRGGWGWRGGWAWRGNSWGWRAGWGWGWNRGVVVARPWGGGWGVTTIGVPVCGCSSFESDWNAPAFSMQLQPVPAAGITPMGNVLPSPRITEPRGPLPYDGGPMNPVPMPKLENQPKAMVPDLMVSLPAAKKYGFAAYGEKPPVSPRLTDDPKAMFVKATTR